MREGPEGPGSSVHLGRDEMSGFEDIVPEGLGNGYWYNTVPSINQLVVALAVAPSPAIKRAVQTDVGAGTNRLVRALRDEQVLAGFKLLDLGCGMVPGLAIAAKSMGAEVHTVDGEPLDLEYGKWVDTHTIADLSDPESISVIEAASGGDLDYVTENILGTVPGHPKWEVPSEHKVRAFGARLLKPGGHHYHAGSDLLQKV